MGRVGFWSEISFFSSCLCLPRGSEVGEEYIPFLDVLCSLIILSYISKRVGTQCVTKSFLFLFLSVARFGPSACI
jgi:hypothetical protein